MERSGMLINVLRVRRQIHKLLSDFPNQV